MYKPGISVCISAYHSKKFIKSTLDSVASQTWFKNHTNYEIIVGVDGDVEDLEYIRSIMKDYKNFRLIMMDSNEGTYVTTNTVMSNAKYEWLLRFDSDDIMHPFMISELMNATSGYDVVTFFHESKTNSKERAQGQILLRHDIFNKFGGYRPWTCGADTEFEKRVFKFVKVNTVNKVLFYRRIFGENLTVRRDTGMYSDVRRVNRNFILNENFRYEAEAVIKKVCNTCCELSYEAPLSIIKLRENGRLKKDAWTSNCKVEDKQPHQNRLRTAVYVKK